MDSTVIDAHQHFWDLQLFDYPWMTGPAEPLRRNYLPVDLKPMLDDAGVRRTVVVQATPSIEESRWLLRLAAAHDFIAGVVVWVDLTSPTLGSILDELQAQSKFCGIRHLVHDEPDEAWIVRSDVLAGLQELERREIPYDLLLRPPHLKYIPRVKERCPRLRMVLDHLGKPRIAEEVLESWAQDVETLARLPNLWCKASGMITEADWRHWTPADLKPYVDHVVRQFGYGRIMFGSDWPVCTLAGSYSRVVDALRQALGPLNPADTAKVWGESARVFYRLA
jgi:L-fucono-1,5-lactonase